MARATLEPTWARFGAGNAQLSFFHRSGVVFGRFLMDFTSFLIDFSCYVRYICWLFREGFGMNFARALKEFYIFWSLLIHFHNRILIIFDVAFCPISENLVKIN